MLLACWVGTFVPKASHAQTRGERPANLRCARARGQRECSSRPLCERQYKGRRPVRRNWPWMRVRCDRGIEEAYIVCPELVPCGRNRFAETFDDGPRLQWIRCAHASGFWLLHQ